MLRPRAPRTLTRLVALLLLLSGLLTGCQVIDTSTITGTIQDAIDSVNQQSDAWRTTLPGLVDKLNDLESQATGDTRSTLNDTVNQVSVLRDQTFDTADRLANDAVATALIQVQCRLTYFQSSVSSFLQYVKARVTFRQAPLPAKRVCTFNPDHIQVDPTQLQGSGKTWLIQVYGYNFFSQALPTVQIRNGADQVIATAANRPVRTSLYQLQLQLVASDFAQVATGTRVTLLWPDHDQTSISVNVSTPALLEVTAFNFPAAVTVNQPIVPQVTVRNSGTVDSGSFLIRWQPDAGKGRVVTQSELSLAGGRTQVYDLPSFSYPQQDYFNVPQVAPIGGLSTIVQIASNAGVGPGSQRSSAFTLQNLPFHALPVVTITNPNVGADWTSYQQAVGVRPGDIVVVSAGGCAQTGGHGDTWKRYVDPDASDEPNLYHGLIAIVPLMPKPNGAPPRGATRLQTAMGAPISVPLNTPNPQFWLGYEDTGYGDNGYNDHDDGTHGQCRGVNGAFVRVTISRN